MDQDPLNHAERLMARRTHWLFKRRIVPYGLLLLGIDIPLSVDIGTGLRLAHNGNGIVIHGATVIGDDVKVYPQVTLGRSDTFLSRDQSRSGGRIEVGDNVTIGTGAKVLYRSGSVLTLGHGCVIGANSVVTESVPAGEIWAGSPARKVGLNPQHQFVAPE